MNRVQKRFVAGGVAVAAFMLLFPPFHLQLSESLSRKMGYGFLFDPPKFGFIESTVNLEQLGLQWLAVAAATGLLAWLTGRR